MKISIVKIGNSQGIRIPKPILDQCRLKNEVELELHDSALIIRSVHKIRDGWDYEFSKMARENDDRLLDDIVTSSEWDNKEWVW